MKLIELVEQQAARLEQSGVFFGHGTTNAFDEAVWLALWRLGLPLDDLDGVADRRLQPIEIQAIRELTDDRIRSRKPAAYLTGEAWLQGLAFDVDERTIVPRSLIAECLADGRLDMLMGQEPHTVLDLCTGNGSLAVLAALAWTACRVDAADLSVAALQVAERNRARHGLESRISLFAGDGLDAVSGRRYDLILCNPPYVNAQSMAQLPPEYQAEPALALAGGVDGMDFIRTLMRQVARHLHPQGWLILEIGHERGHFEEAFAIPLKKVQPLWLDTSAGDDLVLALPAMDLQEAWA